jgi:ribosome recycling factor
MSPADIRQQAEQKMLKAIDSLKHVLSRIRTGRAHAGLLEHVHVDYYGSQVPLSQVANITVLDARTLGVSVWEKKMATVVDKAIREADLGLNPIATGELIRVPMPPLSEERRKELVKLVKGEAEHAKVAVRNLRRDANEQYKKLLKDKAMSEDEERRAQDDVQKLTDRFVATGQSVVPFLGALCIVPRKSSRKRPICQGMWLSSWMATVVGLEQEVFHGLRVIKKVSIV